MSKHKIEGVELIDRGFFADERGYVKHGFRSSEGTIGEAYLSAVNPGAVKAWHIHRRMTLRYVAVNERITVGLADMREHSPSYRQIMKIELSPYGESYKMLVIPPFVANGFRLVERGGIQTPGLILNVADMAHDPDEIKRIAIEDFPIPFEWGDYTVSG